MNNARQAEQISTQSQADWGRGLHDRAMAAMQRAASLDPGNPRYRHMLASWQYNQGNYAAAVDLLKKVLEQAPYDLVAHQNLGLVYHAQGRYRAAAVSYGNVLALDAASPATHCSLGKVLQLLGDHDQAEMHFDQALSLQPEQPEALIGKAVLDELHGHEKKAFGTISELLERYPDNVELAVTYARLAPANDRIPIAVKTLERLLADPESSLAEMHLRYALADLYDNRGQFEQAFEQARLANRLNPMKFDQQRFLDGISDLHASADRISSESCHASEREGVHAVPLFVVGMPRSGTTLVEQILAAHPRVDTAGELSTISELALDLQHRFATSLPYPGALDELSADHLNQIAGSYLHYLLGQAAAIDSSDESPVMIIDKMPANFMHLGFISRLFPDAPVIHCQRDARDVALSCYMRGFSGQGQAFSNDLGSIAVYYNAYRALMSKWHDVLRNPIIDVEYEKLVAEPETTIAELLNALNLDHSDACLRFYENTGVVATASTAQVRKPIYRTSVNKSQHYRAWLDTGLGDEFGQQP